MTQTVSNLLRLGLTTAREMEAKATATEMQARVMATATLATVAAAGEGVAGGEVKAAAEMNDVPL